jgi:hypothetical protein
VYLFLFTNRLATESGVYAISEKFISERTCISINKIKAILNTLQNTYHKITYDKTIVFVHGFLKRNYRGKPELLNFSILKNVEDFQSLLCWNKFLEIYKNHCICNKIKEKLNTYQTLSQVFNDNDNDNDNDKEGMQGEEKRSQFDEFWKLYPKRVGKGAAEKSWAKIKEPVKTIELIKNSLEWQKQTEQWKKNNGQFIPGPAVYLNQRRWEDEQNQPQRPPAGNYIP